ncbi:hypothetical protein [Pseudomonas cavernae]|nr:hypothetical protein [Pseudomonas cavernae]
MLKTSQPLPSRQRGMATILIILLAGMALTVTALGVMHAVRGSQEKLVALHASTHAQAGAWAGVEIFRSYLEQLDASALGALLADDVVDMRIGERTLLAKIVANQAPTPGASDPSYRITANIRNEDSAARAATTLQAVFAITPLNPGQTNTREPWDGALNSFNDLDLRGGIDVKGGDGAKINVQGKVTLNNGSLTGIKTLQATDDIRIGGDTLIEELFSNADIFLENAASSLKASAVENVTITSSGTQGLINANGDVSLQGGQTGVVNALGSIFAQSDTPHGELTAGQRIEMNGGSSGQNNAVGDVRISGGAANTVNSQANVSCSGGSAGTINASGNVSCASAAQINAPVPVSIVLMAPLQPFTLPKPNVDAFELQALANYVFEIEGGKKKVTVRNVNGIPGGVYFLGRYPTPNNDRNDYLCQEVGVDGLCTLPVAATDSRTICQGDSLQSGCFDYADNTWRVRGRSLAPGVMWFAGNLLLGSGSTDGSMFYNGFIATGNIETAASFRSQALNFAGYPVVCANQDPLNRTLLFADLFPSNFCDTATQSLIANSLGNVALLAGGYVDSSFSGGDIALGAASETFGSLVAGNLLLTDGDSTVHGHVTAAGQGSGGSNTFAGNTVIDLRNLPQSFNPGAIPDMSGSGEQTCQTDCEPSDGSQSSQAKLLWSRYL